MLSPLLLMLQSPGLVTSKIMPQVAALAPDSGSSGQAATFSASCTVDSPAVSFNGVYTWAATALDRTAPGSGITITSGQNSASCTAKVTGAGVFALQCTVEYYVPTDMPHPVRTAVVLHKCVALGGPIRVSVVAGDYQTFEHDNNQTTGPWYAQWFGYDGTSTPVNNQKNPQSLKALSPAQPSGTTYAWTVPAPFVSPEPAGSASITLQATGTASGVALRENFTVSIPDYDGSTISGSAMDDTDGSTDGGTALTSKLSAHKPGSSAVDHHYAYVPADSNGNLPPAAYCGSLYTMILNDEAGNPMPGVKVQERFTGTLPPGLKVNPDGMGWTSQLSSPGFFGDDHLYYTWPNYPDPMVTLTATHTYYGATWSTVSGGYSVGAYTITYTSGTPATGQAPYQPGTATQQ